MKNAAIPSLPLAMAVVVNLPNACAAFSPQRLCPRTPPQLSTKQWRIAAVRFESEGAWCGLCGDGGGWVQCGRCMGQGGFPTRPGLAGVKGKVGWGRCKTCFGHKVVPCLFCGVSDWKAWAEHARRQPHKQT